jgi:hypothetical protein
MISDDSGALSAAPCGREFVGAQARRPLPRRTAREHALARLRGGPEFPSAPAVGGRR